MNEEVAIQQSLSDFLTYAIEDSQDGFVVVTIGPDGEGFLFSWEEKKPAEDLN